MFFKLVTTGDFADSELKAPETTAERVQELFREWWPHRYGHEAEQVKFDGKYYLLNVWCQYIISSLVSIFLPPQRTLHFPKAKLAEEQITLLEQAIKEQKKRSTGR